MFLLLSSMALNIQRVWNGAYKQDNRPVASKGKDANSSGLLVGSTLLLLTAE